MRPVGLVVDTNVWVRFPGDPQRREAPLKAEAQRAYLLIDAIDSCAALTVVMSTALLDEYVRVGVFAEAGVETEPRLPDVAEWLATAYERGKVTRVPSPEWDGRGEYLALLENPQHRRSARIQDGEVPEAQKDLLVLELAMCHDRRVVSLDIRQRTLLRKVAAALSKSRAPAPSPHPLSELYWLPTQDASEAVTATAAWLRAGAPDQPSLQIAPA